MTKMPTLTWLTGLSQEYFRFSIKVVDAGIKAALALNMDIHKKMHFDRKNYFYPDNPKKPKFLNLMSQSATTAGLKWS